MCLMIIQINIQIDRLILTFKKIKFTNIDKNSSFIIQMKANSSLNLQNASSVFF